MPQEAELTNLEQLLARIDDAARNKAEVSLEAIRDELGSRTFGPLLLLAGIITVVPVIGDIPGVPTLMGIMVVLIAIQLLLGRQHLWLPRWLTSRSVAQDKVTRATSWTRRPARFVDRLLRPRLLVLVQGPGIYAVAAVCLIIAAAMSPMEIIPFTANSAGFAMISFGLALISRDGALVLLGLLITAFTFGAVAYGLL